MKRHTFLVWFCLVILSVCVQAEAQAAPAAIRPLEVQIGAGFSFAKPDFAAPYINNDFPYIKGFTIYGDATYHHFLGIEADVHYDSVLTPQDIGENTYMAGPKVSLIHEDRMNLYAKVLGGIAGYQYQKNTYSIPHTDTYGAFAVGGGIEFHASPHLSIRAIDIEQQWWPGFTPRGLTPFVTTFGIGYRD